MAANRLTWPLSAAVGAAQRNGAVAISAVDSDFPFEWRPVRRVAQIAVAAGAGMRLAVSEPGGAIVIHLADGLSRGWKHAAARCIHAESDEALSLWRVGPSVAAQFQLVQQWVTVVATGPHKSTQSVRAAQSSASTADSSHSISTSTAGPGVTGSSGGSH